MKGFHTSNEHQSTTDDFEIAGDLADVLQPLASRARRDPSRQLQPKIFKTKRNPLIDVHQTDNEAVVKLKIKGRSPHMRHVSRTHRVKLD